MRKYYKEKRAVADREEHQIVESIQRYMTDRLAMLDSALQTEKSDLKLNDKQLVRQS